MYIFNIYVYNNILLARSVGTSYSACANVTRWVKILGWLRPCPSVLLKPYWQTDFWSSIINKHSLFMQTVVHCQIQQQTITCCNAELSLSNHRYIAHELWMVKYLAKFERWSFGIHYLHLKNVGFWFGVYIAHNSTWDYTTVPSNVWYKTLKKHLFWINTFQIARKAGAAMQISHRCASPRVAAKSTTPSNFQKLASLLLPD